MTIQLEHLSIAKLLQNRQHAQGRKGAEKGKDERIEKGECTKTVGLRRKRNKMYRLE